jgi:thiamine biosynthesis lipoprotein
MVMGTQAEVTAYAIDRTTAQAAIDAAYARFDDVNRLMSDYVDDSEIGRLNGLSGGESLVVSAETFRCIREALEIARVSGGAFDITCRPLVRLWRQAGKEGRLPDEARLQSTMARVGWQKLAIDPTTRAVTVTVDGMQIDLGGIAKGYALDLAVEAMRKAGASAGLVNIGGDMRTFGVRPDGRPWLVGVRHPFRGREEYFAKLALTDEAVATSGVQERFVEIEGRRYSHIVDPRTGRPAEQAPSVTVIAPDGLTADAWATVFSVLSVEEGTALHTELQLPGVEVLWVLPPANGPRVHRSPGFDRYIRK